MASVTSPNLNSLNKGSSCPGSGWLASNSGRLNAIRRTTNIAARTISIIVAMSISMISIINSALSQSETSRQKFDRIMREKESILEQYDTQFKIFSNRVHAINRQRNSALVAAQEKLIRDVGRLIYNAEMANTPQAFVQAWRQSVPIAFRGLRAIYQDSRQLDQIRTLNQNFADFTEQINARISQLDVDAAQATAGPERSTWRLAFTEHAGGTQNLTGECDIYVEQGYGIVEVIESVTNQGFNVINLQADQYETTGRVQYSYVNPDGEQIWIDMYVEQEDDNTIIAQTSVGGQLVGRTTYTRCD